MSVLDWDKPGRVVSIEEWKGISADSAPPGVYTPNMSDEDMKKSFPNSTTVGPGSVTLFKF